MKEAEDIIISKRFFELTPGEMEVVKEFASNEEDYDAMRWFLQSTRSTFAKDKIDAGPSLRKSVLAHLHQAPAQKTIWLNGAAAFLFPKDKKFYQYPALQMAAVGLLLVSFVFIYDGSLKTDQEVAQNLEGQEMTKDQAELEKLNEPGDLTVSESEMRDQVETGDEMNSPGIPAAVPPVEAPEQEALLDELEEGYREMSVAEEARHPEGAGTTAIPQNSTTRADDITISSGEEKTVLAQEYYRNADKNTAGEVSGKVSTENKGNKKVTQDKNNNGRSELNNTTTNDGTSTVNGSATGVPSTTTIAGNITVTDAELAKEKTEKEGGLFLTATAGGVYGDTASTNGVDGDMGGGHKPDADVPASQFSINESKELKGLFFIVK